MSKIVTIDVTNDRDMLMRHFGQQRLVDMTVALKGVEASLKFNKTGSPITAHFEIEGQSMWLSGNLFEIKGGF